MVFAQKTGELATLDGPEGPGAGWTFLSAEEGFARLAANRGKPAVMSSPDGFGHPTCLAAAARAAAGEDSSVFFATARLGGVDHLLPLRVERSFGVSQVVPLGAPLSQYAPSLDMSREALADLLDGLRQTQGADVLLLRRVRSDNPVMPALREIGAIPSQHSEAPYVDLASFGDFEGYLTSFGSKTRRNRRRELRRLEDAGKVEFAVVPGSQAEAVLTQAFSWKRDWLGQMGIASPVLGSENWSKALLECAAAPQSFVSILRVAGVPAAVELGFVEGDSYVAYLGAFDPALGKLSVGQEQMSRTLAWCFDMGYRRATTCCRQGTITSAIGHARQRPWPSPTSPFHCPMPAARRPSPTGGFARWPSSSCFRPPPVCGGFSFPSSRSATSCVPASGPPLSSSWRCSTWLSRAKQPVSPVGLVPAAREDGSIGPAASTRFKRP
jgi:hypothetical protein